MTYMLCFNEPIIYGRLVRRYKRFFMDVAMDNGDVIVAHVPNTGSMHGLLFENARVMLSCHDDPRRRLSFTAQAIEIDNHWVGINTHLPNKLLKASLGHPLLKNLSDYKNIKAEKLYGKNFNSRVDYYFSESKINDPALYLEIKNVTLKNGDHAQFPDTTSTRAQKHMEDLMYEMNQGHRAMLIFIVQRQDCKYFSASRHFDEKYADLLYTAQNFGLHTRALVADVNEIGIRLTDEIDVIF